MLFDILVVIFTIFALNNILFHKNGIQNSILLMVLAFIIGFRTFEPFTGIKIHPIEVIIYASMLRIFSTKVLKYYRMPISIIITGYFFITIFVIDFFTRYNLNVLNEFKNAYLLILIFYIIQYIKVDKAFLQSMLRNYLYVATAIGFMGIVEYVNPSIITILFDTVYNEQNFTSHSLSFNRLAFLWWGAHLAANLIPPAFPILLYLGYERDEIIKNKIILVVILTLNLGAIYLSGNRISWLILTVFFVYTIVIYKNYIIPYIKTSATLIVVIFVIIVYSQPVEGRYISTFKALSGNIDARYDSSGDVRLKHINRAIKAIIEEPKGKGWASEGWLHSDLLQITVSIGIIPSMILFGWIISLFLRLQFTFFSIKKEKKTVLFVLCLFLIHILISLLFNGNILLVQTGTPLFLLLAISYYYYLHNVKLMSHSEYQ